MHHLLIQKTVNYIKADQALTKEKTGALTIYTIHPGGNFRCKYSVLQLVETQSGKIRRCTSINWKVQI